MENFYIICPLNLEKTVLDEINEKFMDYYGKIPDTKVETGGITLSCELEQGLLLNTILKTATRILLRIKTQKCRDFPKLFKIIQKVEWKKYCKREEIEFDITTKESRLINTKKMQETCDEALKKYFNANKFSTKMMEQKDSFSKAKIFIRVVNDDLTISLDTSGDALYYRYNRGEKKVFQGLASIRANIAATLVYQFLKDKREISLIDPMCGSGTFIKEALNFYKINTSRKFYFQEVFNTTPLTQINKTLSIKKAKGFDIDSNNIKKNGIDSEQGDVFKLNLEGDHFAICNPPYGKKVKLSKPRNVYYTELIEKMKKNLKATEISILIPTDIKIKDYKQKTKVFNSGIWLYNYIIITSID